MSDEDIREEPDGTFTVWIDMGAVQPIKGIPTKALAEKIARALWDMERAGADNYAMGEN